MDDDDFFFCSSNGKTSLGAAVLMIIVLVVLIWTIRHFSVQKDRKQLEYINTHHCSVISKINKGNAYQCDNGIWLEYDLREKANESSN
jgi:hypothetical protein